MVDHRPLALLPMQFTGIPVRVVRWLRAAGIPSAEFTSGAAAVGRATTAETRGPLLFDSRTPASRADAEHAAARGWKTIDIARLLVQRRNDVNEDSQFVLFDQSAPAPFERFQRHEFLDRLKTHVESAGGVWARIADYPFPCRNALIEFTDAGELDVVAFGDDAESFVSAADDEGLSAQDLKALFGENYAAGRPVLAPLDENPSSSRLAELVTGGDDFPFVWRTSPAEFANWRCARERMSFRLEQAEPACRIECVFDHAGRRPALEFWRGDHVATIPMPYEPMALPLTGLVFQRSGGRHPVGFTAAPDSPFSTETSSKARSAG